MKNITTFQAFGILKKVGAEKTYTKKRTGEESILQNFSVNGHLFSMFGQSQISYHSKLIGKNVILFGRIECRQTDNGFHTSFLCDSLREDFSESEDIFDD